MTRFSLTPKSSNRKTGPIAVSMTSSESCPSSCPLAKAGCYAKQSFVGMQWRKVDKAGMESGDFFAKLRALPHGTKFRHNVAGDLPGDGAAIDTYLLDALVSAATRLRAFTYTHYRPELGRNAGAIRDAIRRGFTINLSAHDFADADRLKAEGFPVVVTLPAGFSEKGCYTPAGNRVVTCPATYRDDKTCENCMLCAVSSSKRAIVGFPAHGNGAKKVPYDRALDAQKGTE